MNDDERCCGTGTCMINAQGVCWCGQQWNGVEMCRPESVAINFPDSSDLPQRQAVEKLLQSGND